MTDERYMSNLLPPKGKIEAVLDTDAYNEIDDQFALSYLLKYPEKVNLLAVFAAPFLNGRSVSPADGMEKSYDEIKKLLGLAGVEKPVFRGSEKYLPDEKTPVVSDAAAELVRLASEHSPEKPLYVVAIGAITNIASTLIMNPEIAENVVIVWLGGHAHSWPNTKEFNMYQDIAAARVVMSSPAPFVQLPCMGVVSEFRVSGPELEYWLRGKNRLADYLADQTIAEAESYAAGTAWTRVVWDVTAAAWLVNDGNRFLVPEIRQTVLPGYDFRYRDEIDKKCVYVRQIRRDALMTDLMKRLTEE
ncbi:MAG: nucleoside hydrolase [Clostridia bacterium]|nr:nucleoside hydrolase [Clostridia bacterium]